jgi:hypothetical protein
MSKDLFTKQWITDNAIEIVSRYEKGVLTLRGLHYQLVSIGMTNSTQHYKRVINAMIDARWDELIDFDAFSDNDRAMIGDTFWKPTDLDDEIQTGKNQVRAWMTSYHKNKWENQPIVPEVLIEKKALQGVFGPICEDLGVSLGACKGYPSLTFLNDLQLRFSDIIDEGKKPMILYFGDYDPSGEDIPRSIIENLKRFGLDEDSFALKRFALMEHQVIEWKLPPAPAKTTDSRTKNWDGLGQVELDAVKPEKLQSMCKEAIEECFDDELYEELEEQEAAEKLLYVANLKDFVNNL